MLELLLLGQVPASHHARVLGILSGLTAMQPEAVLERHILYRPAKKLVQQQSHVGGSQSIKQQKMQRTKAAQTKEPTYCQLVGRPRTNDFDNTERTSSVQALEKQKELLGELDWSLEIKDPPLPEKRSVMVRSVAQIPMGNNALEDMSARGNIYVEEYITEGHMFIKDNIVLRLTRTLRLPTREIKLTAPLALLPLDSLTPLDEQDGRILKSSIFISEQFKPELLLSAISELEALRDQMKGVVALKLVDRLSLDSRIK